MDNRNFYYPDTSVNLIQNRVDARDKNNYNVMDRKRVMQGNQKTARSILNKLFLPKLETAQKLIKRTWEKKIKEKLIMQTGGRLPKSLNIDLYRPEYFKKKKAKLAENDNDMWKVDLKPEDYVLKNKLEDLINNPPEEQPRLTQDQKEKAEKEEAERRNEMLISDLDKRPSDMDQISRPPTPSDKSHDTFRTSWSHETDPYHRAKALMRMKDFEWDQSLDSMMNRYSDWDPEGTTEDYLGQDPQELYLQGFQPDKFIRAAYRNSIDESFVRKDAERSLGRDSNDRTVGPDFLYQHIGMEQSIPEKDTLMQKIVPSALEPTSIFHKWAESEDKHDTQSWDDIKLGRYELRKSEWSSENDSRFLYEPLQKALYREDPVHRAEFLRDKARKKRWKKNQEEELRKRKHEKREERRENGEEDVSETSTVPPSSYIPERRDTQSTTSYLDQFSQTTNIAPTEDAALPFPSDQIPRPQRGEDDLPEDRHLRPDDRNKLQAYWAQVVMQPPDAMEYPFYAFPENRYNVFPMNQQIGKLEYEVNYLQKKYDQSFWKDQNLHRLDMDADDARSDYDLYQEWYKIPVGTVLRHDFWELREKQAIVKPRG